MNTDENKRTKPASDDPVKQAKGHPNGPGLLEMLSGQEEKKLDKDNKLKKAPDNPDIPII